MRLIALPALSFPCKHNSHVVSLSDRSAEDLAMRIIGRHGRPDLILASKCGCAAHTARPFLARAPQEPCTTIPECIDAWRYWHPCDLRANRNLAHTWVNCFARAYRYAETELRVRGNEKGLCVAVTHPALIVAGRWWLGRGKIFLGPGASVKLTDAELDDTSMLTHGFESPPAFRAAS